ncbi:cell division protein FtsA, partial [Bacteroidales bacterium OttesenSCG-928-L03]|nr:cell division protein FtsA [Bacteroidales bacterium OttesenSCG-928-L03]
MEQTKYIAAIDPGTSTIRAMVAHKNEGSVLSILAAEEVDSGNCIRRGYVYNINETSTKIASLITRLNRKLTDPVAKVYLGIGGQSVHSMPYSVKENISGESVTQDILDYLMLECQSYQPENLEVLDIVSPEYLIDGRLEPKPLGVIGHTIEARFQLILGRPSLKSNLEKCIPEGGKYSVAGYFITPLATAEAVLTDEEKLLGCALVEFGAGVTYVSVYKNGSLQLLSTIPLGGDVITKDIQTMNLLEADAERLKVGGGLEDREVD